MLNFEQFTAHSRDAKLIRVSNGYVFVDGHFFFDPSLKSRKVCRAFVTDTIPWRLVQCLSERGNSICLARETDHMGLTVLHPDYMGWPGSPWTLMFEQAKEDPSL